MAEVKTQMRARAELQSAISMAVRKAMTAERQTTSLRAGIVRAVIAARKGGLSRSLIGKAILKELEAHKQRTLVRGLNGRTTWTDRDMSRSIAARYVRMARWAVHQWAKGEKHVSEVDIDGHSYKSPLAAMDSERFSFNRVYQAWKDAVKPPLVDLNALPKSIQESAESMMKKLSLTLIDGDKVTRVKVMENVEALAACFRLLRQSPLAQQAEQMATMEVAVQAPLRPARRRKAA